MKIYYVCNIVFIEQFLVVDLTLFKVFAIILNTVCD